MFERNISVHAVRRILQNGETIHQYPDDKPYPSRLMLGYDDGRPIHVVAADHPEETLTVVITVYEPDPLLWSSDFRERVPR